MPMEHLLSVRDGVTAVPSSSTMAVGQTLTAPPRKWALCHNSEECCKGPGERTGLGLGSEGGQTTL